MARYVKLNKPYRVLSQFTPDQPGQQTLAEFGLPKEIYAAGRLDFDSEGLLLLTDDGAMIKRLLDPMHGHERTYWVQVEGDITESALRQLAEGVVIGGYKTLPAKARILTDPDVPDRNPPIRSRQSIPTSWIEMRLMEGKNRQVRRMTAAVGHPTLRLIRYSIGPITLDGLNPGQWKELSPEEVIAIKRLVGPAK